MKNEIGKIVEISIRDHDQIQDPDIRSIQKIDRDPVRRQDQNISHNRHLINESVPVLEIKSTTESVPEAGRASL
jgi:hypothetical protein